MSLPPPPFPCESLILKSTTIATVLLGVYEVEAPIQSMTLGAVANRNGAPLALMLLRSFNDISVIVLEQDSEGDLEVLPLGIEPDDLYDRRDFDCVTVIV